jgi:hypothetical protein
VPSLDQPAKEVPEQISPVAMDGVPGLRDESGVLRGEQSSEHTLLDPVLVVARGDHPPCIPNQVVELDML